ncbi:MAG: UDP-2,3-diacylglucosamine diphosphatase [Gallionellaceae bacterium]|nr:UDP-2,3-diacylglucosamine diphosphatase [Gallionellaceae bacterium]
MLYSLFISDLHLCEHSPTTTRLFHHFMQHSAPHAEALYILGDLFEYWAGDDDLNSPFHLEITGTLRALTAQGVKLFIMHGNRDFLMAEKLATACNATLLTDPTLLNLYGKQTLLTHGDALCTDDLDYQMFRQQVRATTWQQQFLAQPLAQRKAQIEQVRQHSTAGKKLKAESIMDVNQNSVHELLREHDYPQIIHGHTHRPAHHLHHVDERTCDRWVLGDWDTHANALRCDATGISWEKIPA